MLDFNTEISTLILFVLFSGFVKICTTLSIFRYGLGLTGVGFGLVVLFLSFAASAFISESSGGIQLKEIFSGESKQTMEKAKPFLEKNTDPKVLIQLTEMETKMGKPSESKLLLAFLISELQSAFELGLLIIIPFVLIDLLVTNMMLTLGVTQISALVISLPLKLLLFISVGGWNLIINKILKTYVG